MPTPTVPTQEQPYVSIPAEANLREWGPVRELVAEVLDWVAAQGLELTVPPFFRYSTSGDEAERFQLEVGAPVGEPVIGADATAGLIPAGAYATLCTPGIRTVSTSPWRC